MRGSLRSVIETIVLDPAVTYRIHYARNRDEIDWKTGRIIQVTSARITTNNRSMIMGEPGNYKGSYKQIIESLTEYMLSQKGIRRRVRLDIVGDNGPIHRLIPVGTALSHGLIEKSSPVFLTATRYSIPHILIRGPHIEGPNPELAELVDDTLSSGQKMLDLFAGTGLVAKIALRRNATEIVSLDMNTANTLAIMFRTSNRSSKFSFLQEDAFGFDVQEDFDLVVADPDFEDSLRVAAEIAPRLKDKCKKMILCHGYIEDRAWNRRVRKKLAESASKVKPVEKSSHAFSICEFS